MELKQALEILSKAHTRDSANGFIVMERASIVPGLGKDGREYSEAWTTVRNWLSAPEDQPEQQAAKTAKRIR